MLQIITGTDSAARKNARMRIAADAVELSAGDDALTIIHGNFLNDGGFFGEQKSVIIKNASEIPGLVEFLEKHVDDINAAVHTLILDDIEFTLAQEKFFKAKKITISEFDLPKTDAANVFALTDALATGSKKSAYGMYHTLLRSGISADDMVAPIWWWLKNLGQTYHGVRDAKPFVQKKLDAAVKIFGDTVPDMIVNFSIAVDNSRTVSKIELELEQWIIRSMVRN